jgi:hypothetical protein
MVDQMVHMDLMPFHTISCSSQTCLRLDCVQVVVYGTFKKDSKPDRQDITSILKAGGAVLLSLAEALAHGADLAIMRADLPSSDAKVPNPLLAAEHIFYPKR